MMVIRSQQEQIRKALGLYSKKYETILLMGDYYVDIKETNGKVFATNIS